MENGGYDRDLIPLKLYQAISDDNIEPDDIRVIDEAGEEHVYPAKYFALVEMSEPDEENIKRILAEKVSDNR